MANHGNLRAAIVGLRHGHVGTFGPEIPGFIHSFKHLQGVELVAYCEDTDLSRLDEARTYDPSAHFYTDLDDLISHEKFDLAWVVLPANEVPKAGIKLAEAGKHFYMEKQFARRAGDLAELVKVVHKSGVKVLPGYPHRFNPVAQDLKEMIDKGTLGRPLDIEIRMYTGQVRPGGRDPENFVYKNESEGGGILHMLGGHFLELSRFLMGCEVKWVQAMNGRPVGYIEEPLEDLSIATFEFENGAFGSIHAGYLKRSPGRNDSSLVFCGLDGHADWTPIGGPNLTVSSTCADWRGSPEKTFNYSFPPAPGYGGSVWMLNWLQRFIRDIQNNQEPSLTVDDALHVLQLIDAAYESAYSGKRIEVKYGV